MSAYDQRSIVQFPGGTDAVRQTKVLGARELWFNVDGGGVPTGDVYVGDGTTTGGLGPFRPQALLDHGSLAGLTDDDHAQYALTNGTRTFTGPITVTGAISGVDLNASDSVIPTLTMTALTGTDAFFGRLSAWYLLGYTSTATLHALGALFAYHGSAANDQKGVVGIAANTGAQGLAPSIFFEVDGSVPCIRAINAAQLQDSDARDHTQAFHGASRTKSGGQALPSGASIGTWANVTFATSLHTNATDFSWSSPDMTVNFTGYVAISVDLSCQDTNNTFERWDWEYELQRDTGGGYSTPAACYRCGSAVTEVGGTVGCNSASISRRIFSVTSGDKFRVRARQTIGSSGTLSLIQQGALFTFERILDPTT